MSIEYRHKFAGSSGTLLVGQTPELGSAWVSDGANMFPGSAVKLDGLGFTYNGNASASSLILAQGTFAGSTHQVRWPMCFRTDLGILRTAGVAFYAGNASSPDDCRFNWAQGGYTLTMGTGNGGPFTATYAFPAANTTPEYRATLIDGVSIQIEVSTDYGVTWSDVFGGAKPRTVGSQPFRPGIWYDGGMSPTTGVQVGNLRIGATPLVFGLSVSPNTGTTGGNVSVTFTAPAGGWHPGSGLPALSVTAGGTGASVGTQAVTDFDSRTAVVACGSAAGVLTITDPSGGTTSFTVSSSPSLTPGTATAGSTTTTTAAATATEATGGTSPYTHQWYRSTTSGQLGSPVSGQTSTTLADSGLTPATTYYYTLRYTDATTAHVDSNQVTEATTGGALTAGVATAGSTTDVTASASATDASGGTSPYTYQWYRSTTSGLLGSPVSGQTTRDLSDSGLTPSTAYYYTLRYTDATTAHVDSNQVAETTSASAPASVNYLSVVSGFATGLAGTIGYRVYANVTASGSRTTSGVVERPSGSGTYRVIAACPAASLIEFDWDDGAGNALTDGDPQPLPPSTQASTGTTVFDSGAVSSTPVAPTASGFWASGGGLLGASGDYVGMSVLFQASGKPARSRKVSAHSVVAGFHYFALAWSGYPQLPSAPAVGDPFEIVP